MFSASKTSGPSGYNLTNSLRFRGSASAYLNRTPASAGNRRTWTWSGWVKRGALNGGGSDMCLFNAGTTSPDYDGFRIKSDTISFYQGGAVSVNIESTQVFRDPSAWYHFVLAVDTTQATASNRVKIYVNGNQITAFGTANYPALNAQAAINNTYIHNIAAQYANTSSSSFFDGYMDEINFIDGQALTPSSFGSTNTTTGVWQPARYAGTYGTNGFYLNFTDIALTSGSNAGLGKDFSGNGNYWNTNNISVTAGTTYDAMSDVPTLTSPTVANYCVLNATAPYGSSLTLSQGNLRTTCAGAYWAALPGTFLIPSTGKWYWEVTPVTVNFSTGNIAIGITKNITSQYNTGQDQWPGFTADSYGVTNDVSSMYKWTNVTPVAYGSSYTISDIIGVGLDMDAGTLTFYKNGVSQGVAFSGLTGNFVPSLGVNNTGTSAAINFGQRPFSYTPPSGFVRLNTFNLPDSTIKKGNTVMDATLYTGTGVARSVTNAAGFKPDLVWGKSRTSAENNTLTNSVVGTTAFLNSNTTGAETSSGTNALTSFNSNGFSVGTWNEYNANGQNYVAWQWQAGQGSTSSNTNGSITSTVSVNTTAGFSIVTYTGTGANATVGHGLGVAPRMIIVKNRTTGGGNGIWRVYHTSLGGTKYINLNETTAVTTGSTVWNNTDPTSSVFSVGITGSVNDSGNNYVAYCWSEIAGFSAFGSYTGNGSTNGPFIYLGFRPEFVMIKKSSSTGSWAIVDSTRNPYNVANTSLYPDLSNAENSSFEARDYLSNGFKLRTTDQNSNQSGQTFIYAAFAENPFKNANAR